MSRFLIAFSFVASLTGSAMAEGHFAQPPVPAVSEAQLRVAPHFEVTRAQVRAKLVAQRAANLARFRTYQRGGVFPSNTYSDQKLNVWRDEDGHFCAAATIIRMSGLTDLVDRVAEQSNFIRLADVKQGPLMDWILTSGFTQDEIAAIQEPFMPVVDEPQPVPSEPIVVDNGLRQRENRRLIAKYKAVDAMIVKGTQKSLDAATELLVKRPDLAAKLMAN